MFVTLGRHNGVAFRLGLFLEALFCYPGCTTASRQHFSSMMEEQRLYTEWHMKKTASQIRVSPSTCLACHDSHLHRAWGSNGF
eukprot:5561100-Amphidinium_carterae.1